MDKNTVKQKAVLRRKWPFISGKHLTFEGLSAFAFYFCACVSFSLNTLVSSHSSKIVWLIQLVF